MRKCYCSLLAVLSWIKVLISVFTILKLKKLHFFLSRIPGIKKFSHYTSLNVFSLADIIVVWNFIQIFGGTKSLANLRTSCYSEEEIRFRYSRGNQRRYVPCFFKLSVCIFLLEQVGFMPLRKLID